MTFSLLISDSTRSFMVAASATKTLSVGAHVLALRPGVGGVLSQALTNPLLRGRSLAGLEQGLDPAAAIDQALANDSEIEARQVALMNLTGEAASRTGSACLDAVAQQTGSGFVVIGNLLKHESVIGAMTEEYAEVTGLEELCKLAMRMMFAGEKAGGDSRGVQSAAILGRDMSGTADEFSVAEIDIRVDDNHQPLLELDRILDLALKELPLRLKS